MPLAVGGLVLGLFAARTDSLVFPLALLGCLVPVLLLAHRRVGSAVLIVVVFTACGWVRGWPETASKFREPPGRLPRLVVGGWVESLARVSDHRGGERHRLVLRLTEAPFAVGGPVVGDGVRLSVGDGGEVFRIGDGIQARLALRRVRGFCNRGEDRWARHLQARGVQWTAWENDARRLKPIGIEGPGALLGRFRGHVGDLIDQAAAGRSGAVLHAVLLGDTGPITPALRTTFAWTGTVHLLAVSGLHLAMVVAGTFFAVRWALVLGPVARIGVPLDVLATPIALVMAIGFTLLTGSQVATRRALFMATFVGVGFLLGRRGAPLHPLWASVGCLALLDPGVLLEIGFQFSVTAVAAILLVLRPGGSGPPGGVGRSRRNRGVERVRQALVVGFAAWLATAPLTAWHFGGVPLAGILASPVLTPILGGAALAIGLPAVLLAPWPFLARPLLEVAAAVVEIGLTMAEAVSARVGPPFPVDLTDIHAVTGWTLLALAGCAPARSAFRRVPLAGAAVFFGIYVVGLLPESRGLRVSFLDVGQGDAVIVEEQGGGPALIVDGGGLGGHFDPGARVLLPGLHSRGIGALAAIILSHPDRDHYGGLAAVVDGVSANEFWSSGETSQAQGFAVLSETLERRNVPIRRLGAGDSPLGGGQGMAVEILHPPATPFRGRRNDGSLVLAVRFGATRVLFPGDVERRGERVLLRTGMDLGATLLKVPHHGSATSSTKAFVEAVRPILAIASLGASNPWGFPARAVVDRYGGAGASFGTTADWGEVVIETDGQLERVETCRPRMGENRAGI